MIHHDVERHGVAAATAIGIPARDGVEGRNGDDADVFDTFPLPR